MSNKAILSSAWTSLCGKLTLGSFTGLMGINIGGMPDIKDIAAFWIVVAMCIGVMHALGVVFRWKKWM